ncbi:choline permease [Fusarium heterosporum]|uniref:Choline permease n=1 Tax=Fusarium heterosporum TaxID=42747 RepID=A0A8H5WV10_FUSHE|nr:choline permease [Fusarium heterosporum]
MEASSLAPTDNEKHLGSQSPESQNLERLGYTQEVKRRFSLTAMVALCVNLMCTWEALSSTLAAGLVSGGLVSLIYGSIVAFCGSICGAMSLAELASSFPTAGGQYHFVAKLSPRSTRPLTSWLAGYISTLGWISLAGSAPFLAGTQIQGLIVLNYPETYVFERWHGTMLFWLILVASAAVSVLCNNALPLIEKLTLVLHVGLFIIIIVTVAVVSPSKHTPKFVFTTFENNSGWSNDAVAWCIGLLSSCYVLVGYDGATHLSEEMEKAETGVPRAMIGSILINWPLGFGFLLVILFFMGDIASALNTPAGFPIIQIFYNVTGSVTAATCLAGAITAMAALSTVSLLTSAARVMWAFARDGGLPFSQYIAKVDKRREIPTISILVVTFLLMLFGLINIGSTTAFNAILSLAIVSLQLSYLVPIILLIWRRLCRPETLSWGPWRLGKGGLFINIVAAIYLLFTCIFLLFPPFRPVTAANMNYASVVLSGALRKSDGKLYFKRPSKFHISSNDLNNPPNLEYRQPAPDGIADVRNREVDASLARNDIIFNCVMTMSASHLSRQGSDASATLVFQTEAISQISREISNMELGSSALIPYSKGSYPTDVQGLHRLIVKDDLLLGIILIGMTSSWHDPASLGLCHFHGARQLFNIWMTENDIANLQVPFPCMDILIHLAKCMVVVRQRRIKHETMCNTDFPSSDFYSVDRAFALAQETGNIYIPKVIEIKETGDPFTSADHLHRIAHCHRLVAKLELYRNYPELRRSFPDVTSLKLSGPSMEVKYGQLALHYEITLALAMEILEVMQTIHEESRTVAIQTLILLSAGSALGLYSTEDSRRVQQITRWRNFVLERLHKSFRSLKLDTILRVATILREVWSRMDSLETGAPGYGSTILHVHWMDVMIEKKLETILG